jgi:formylglycine-generating enzyme required for sulfatase activity
MKTTTWVAFCLLLTAAFSIHAETLPGDIVSGHRVGVTFRDCSNCPAMVRLSAGSFLIGSPASEAGRGDDEDPQRILRVRAFAIGAYTVTFDEWDACVSARGCSRTPSDWGWGRGRRPVINVSWNDAQQYVRWLTQKTGHTYRLPSEVEWEYAARAGTTTAYYWGDKVGRGHANCGGCGSPWDSSWQTAPAGSFDPNPWGLYDMLGNVEQWTQDCYHYSYRDAPSDGSAWTGGDCRGRVVRGGSWLSDPREVRAARSIHYYATFCSRYLGFRVARD